MNILSSLLEIIYPPRCHICMEFMDVHPVGRGDICDECFSNLIPLAHPYCSICGEPFKSKVEEDHLCEKCIRRKPFYDELRSPYLYEQDLMTAVQAIKYGGKSYIVKSMGPLLADFAKERITSMEDMIIMPVPLHKKKLRQRGFNQSALMVKEISPVLDIEADYFSLIRIRDTETQAGLNLEQRRKNVKGAFDLRGERNLKGKTVILVDDVATTGNTINECAKVLKKAGCEKVMGLTLARTPAY